jgi:hypothetical protein
MNKLLLEMLWSHEFKKVFTVIRELSCLKINFQLENARDQPRFSSYISIQLRIGMHKYSNIEL